MGLRCNNVPKAIQRYNYMNEANVSEEIALVHIKHIIDDACKELNECLKLATSSDFNPNFVIAVVAASVYHRGDGFGDPDHNEMKRQAMALFSEQVPLKDPN
ncbi:hypothetical protein ACLOJK_003039 [Asimina triloba]